MIIMMKFFKKNREKIFETILKSNFLFKKRKITLEKKMNEVIMINNDNDRILKETIREK